MLCYAGLYEVLVIATNVWLIHDHRCVGSVCVCVRGQFRVSTVGAYASVWTTLISLGCRIRVRTPAVRRRVLLPASRCSRHNTALPGQVWLFEGHGRVPCLEPYVVPFCSMKALRNRVLVDQQSSRYVSVEIETGH